MDITNKYFYIIIIQKQVELIFSQYIPYINTLVSSYMYEHIYAPFIQRKYAFITHNLTPIIEIHCLFNEENKIWQTLITITQDLFIW